VLSVLYVLSPNLQCFIKCYNYFSCDVKEKLHAIKKLLTYNVVTKLQSDSVSNNEPLAHIKVAHF